MKNERRLHVESILLLLIFFLSSNEAFTALSSGGVRSIWRIGAVIKGEEENMVPFDVGEGGVRLAEQSAIKIAGKVEHKPGKADSQPMELLRFNTIRKIEEDAVTAILQTTGSKILGTGSGAEMYTDPGETTSKEVRLAPIEAMKDALAKSASAMESDKLVINFLGGDDLMMIEVMDAASEMVLNLDVTTKAEITFNSLCHSSVPAGTCTVALFSVTEQDEKDEGTDFSGTEKSVANGEAYFRDGEWWTTAESDITLDVA